MSTALAVRQDQDAWSVTQLAALRSLGVEQVDQGTLDMFLSACQRTRLDPWLRQIYLNGRWDNKSGRMKWGIQSSIDGLRIVAQRSGEYEGQTLTEWCGRDGVWTDTWFETTPPAAARVGVFRTKFRAPLYAVAHWTEYEVKGAGDFMWRKMPALMLGKVAEALALRKAFPQDLSGIYTSDEMAQSGQPNPLPEQMDDASRGLLVQALLDELDGASSDDDLRALWHQAGEARMLNEQVGNSTFAALITERREDLKARAASDAAGEVEGEVVSEELPDEPPARPKGKRAKVETYASGATADEAVSDAGEAF